MKTKDLYQLIVYSKVVPRRHGVILDLRERGYETLEAFHLVDKVEREFGDELEKKGYRTLRQSIEVLNHFRELYTGSLRFRISLAQR